MAFNHIKLFRNRKIKNNSMSDTASFYGLYIRKDVDGHSMLTCHDNV